MKQWYTIKEVANTLQCSTRTVRRKLDNLDKKGLTKVDKGKIFVKATFFGLVDSKTPDQDSNNTQNTIRLLQEINSKVTDHLQGEIERLQKQNDSLHERLAEKDKDLKALMSKVVSLQEAKEQLLLEGKKEQSAPKEQSNTVTFKDGQRLAILVFAMLSFFVLLFSVLSK